MAKTLLEHYNKKNKPGHVGIEIEVEYKPGRIPYVPDGCQIGSWLCHDHEQSLENGVEYYLRAPIKTGKDLLPKIRVLTDNLNAVEDRVDHDSGRGSVHVHVNVLTLTPLQIWTSVCAYLLFEDSIIESVCGKKRRGNHFCLRTRDAESFINYYVQDVVNLHRPPFYLLEPDSSKNATLNLSHLTGFGSLEFRGMEATIDPVRIANWASSLYELVHTVSAKFKSPEDLATHVVSCTPAQACSTILPDLLSAAVQHTPGYERNFEKQLALVSQLLYAVPDWESWERDHDERGGPPQAPSTVVESSSFSFPPNFASFVTVGGMSNTALQVTPTSWIITEDV